MFNTLNNYSKPSGQTQQPRISGVMSVNNRVLKPVRLQNCASFVVLLILSFSTVSAAERSDALLKLVGDDVGICLFAPDLETSLPAIEQTKFFGRVQNLSVVREWMESGDYAKLKRLTRSIEGVTDKPFGQFTREMFGRSVVFALYPADEGQPNGVLLTETAGADFLEKSLAAWNRAGRHETESIDHSGYRYYRRSKLSKSGKRVYSLYYLKLNHIFALSNRESMMKRIIGLKVRSDQINAKTSETATPNGPGNLLDSPEFAKLQQKLSAKSFATVYLNTRVCADCLGLKSLANGRNKILSALWAHCTAIVIGVRLDEGIVVEAVAHYDGSNHSDDWKEMLRASSGGAPQFLKKIPRHAVAAFAGRQSARAVSQLLVNHMPGNQKHQWQCVQQVGRGLLLGLDLVDDVLPGVGPNICAYVVARRDARKGDFPADALIAMQLSKPSKPSDPPTANPKAASAKATDPSVADPSVAGPASVGRKPKLRGALDNALNTGLNLLAAYGNMEAKTQPSIVQTENTDSSLLRWIDGPDSFQPAYALTQDAVAIASSPRLLREFMEDRSNDSLATRPELRRLAAKYFPHASQIAFIDVAALRHLVRRHQNLLREPTEADSPDTHSKTKTDPAEEILSLFDSAFTAAHAEADFLHVVLGGVVRVRELASTKAR